MKIFLFVVLFSSSISWGQEIFTSPLTQYFPSGEIKEIHRKLIFTEDEITLSTSTSEGRDFQRFLIKDIDQQEYQNFGQCSFYYCTSLDEKFKTIFIIPHTKKIEVIDIIQPKQQMSPHRHFRLHIN